MPTTLMNSTKLLLGMEKTSEYSVTIIITLILSVAILAISIPIMNKRKI